MVEVSELRKTARDSWIIPLFRAAQKKLSSINGEFMAISLNQLLATMIEIQNKPLAPLALATSSDGQFCRSTAIVT